MLSDPNILFSMINMKLRDDSYDSLDDLCLASDFDKDALIDKLSNAGYVYDAEQKQFKVR